MRQISLHCRHCDADGDNVHVRSHNCIAGRKKQGVYCTTKASQIKRHCTDINRLRYIPYVGMPSMRINKIELDGWKSTGSGRLVSLRRRFRSRSLESHTVGLQSLWLANRLKPWLRTIDGLRWLMAASHGLRAQTRK